MKFTDYLEKIRQDPEYRQAEEELKLAFDLADAVLSARLKAGLSQTELARRVGTRQANISRIESGLANPTIKLLNRLRKVLNLKISIEENDKIQVSTRTDTVFSIVHIYKYQNITNPYTVRPEAHRTAEQQVDYV